MNNHYSNSDKELVALCGQKIKDLRIAANLSQTELALKVGLSRSSIAEIEKGRNFSIASLISIFRAFNKLNELNYFFRPEEYKLTPMQIYNLENKKRKRGGYKK